MNKRVIGVLKSKVNVYCSVCSVKHTRNIKVNIYENTDEEIKIAKQTIINRSKKAYTCRICRSIVETI